MKFKIKNFFLLIIFFSNSLMLLSNEDYVLIPKNILDVRSGSLIKGNIHIKGGIIVAINQKLSNDKNKNIIIDGVTLIHGLMDSHVHLIGNNELNGYESIS